MADFIAPILAVVVGAALSAIIAYPLGRMQGRQQTLYAEQVKIISEVRRLILEANEALFLASARPDLDDYRNDFLEKSSRLARYHRQKEIWLDKKLNEKVSVIIKGYEDQISKLLAGQEGQGRVPAFEVDEHRASERIMKWFREEGRALVRELELEARKLLGTDERAWWSKMLGH